MVVGGRPCLNTSRTELLRAACHAASLSIRPDLSLFLSRSGGREKRMVSFILVDRTHGRNEGQAEEKYVVLHLLSTQRDCARAVGSLARSPPSLAAELGETIQIVTARSAFLDSELQERMKERSMR